MLKWTKAFNRRCPARPDGSFLLTCSSRARPRSPLLPRASACPSRNAAWSQSVPPIALQPRLHPGQGGDGCAVLRFYAAMRAYLAPGTQNLPRPRLYAAEQRVSDHSQHGVAEGSGRLLGHSGRPSREAGFTGRAGSEQSGDWGGAAAVWGVAGAGSLQAPPTQEV